MLRLTNVVKEYGTAENKVLALKGVSLDFRKNEFVSILGASGCGKTTMLNIVGGLDRYTEGDIIIDGVSTKKYKDVDWDTYRNHKIGFIFQSYNLISHLNIIENVELSLTLSGIGASERKKRAEAALEAVGLQEKKNKKPNQLSGGQMQRVSIARALVNNPSIILADEPTGALDSVTSVQIMELLKELAKDRLVIMVTHNRELAETYSTRIVTISDGQIVSDSNPYDYTQEMEIDAEKKKVEEKKLLEESIEEESVINENVSVADSVEDKKAKKKDKLIVKAKKRVLKHSSMSFLTAVKLSAKNMLTKKGRTVMTAIASSIGIIGVALVLAISNGFTGYISDMERTTLAGYPITVEQAGIDLAKAMTVMSSADTSENKKRPNEDVIVYYSNSSIVDAMEIIQTNNITDEMVSALEKTVSLGYASAVQKTYGYNMTVVGKIEKKSGMTYEKLNASAGGMSMSSIMSSGYDIGWQALVGNESYTLSQYDVVEGVFPTQANQVVLIIDQYNQVSKSVYDSLNLSGKQTGFSEVIGKKFKVVGNDNVYSQNSAGYFDESEDYERMYSVGEKNIEVEIVGIIREKEGMLMTMQTPGVGYTQALAEEMLVIEDNSAIVKAQRLAKDYDVISGKTLDEINEGNTGILASISKTTHKTLLQKIGGDKTPITVSIYPLNFEGKEKIISYIANYNLTAEDKISFSDMSAIATSTMKQMVKVISIVLVCFAAVSLLVSSVMISIITYVSVVERTKEIGILRSLGARKKDIAGVFNAETFIIGFGSGVLGVIITYLLSIPINLIIKAKIGIGTLCMLSPWHALLMIGISILLTVIAGLSPALMASKKDPVIALRTE